jgi:lipopolysaccharide export LptBFGC system permease protein LptF
MGKTFGLTAVGLTGLFALGGGVSNMIEAGQVSVSELGQMMLLILPMGAALTLPVAALFAATAAYGRLSADNELVACRSGGINLHVLMLPCLTISVISGLFTFFCIHFFVPGLVKKLEEYIRHDIQTTIQRGISQAKRLSLPGQPRYRFYAEDFDDGTPLQDEHGSIVQIVLGRVAFLDADADEFRGYGTARQLILEVDDRGEEPLIKVDMLRVKGGGEVMGGAASERITTDWTPLPFGLAFPVKIKMLTLGQLLAFREEPERLEEVQEELAILRAGLAREFFYESIINQFQGSIDAGGRKKGEVNLTAGDRGYVIRADSLTPDFATRQPTLDNVEMTVFGPMGTQYIKADTVSIEVAEEMNLDEASFSIRAAGNVASSRQQDGSDVVHRPSENFSMLAIPQAVKDYGAAFTDEQLMNPATLFANRDWVKDQQQEVLDKRAETLREIDSVIHARTAFSASAIVLVLFGGAIGIVFRGSHLLTAFGVAFLPTLFVVVTIIAGRQLMENASSAELGQVVTWGGMGVVALLDLFVLTKVLRR